MATYTGLQRTLLVKAKEYHNLGYKVGYSREKEFLGVYAPKQVQSWYGAMITQDPDDVPEDFNGISVIPEGIACVDLDINDFGVIWMGALPPTWKERTPRGWHLFYKLPPAEMVHGRAWTTKIKWQPHVDLLTKDTPNPSKVKRRSPYGGMKEDGSPWGEHVLISPTPGYECRWPEGGVPHKDKLTEAPIWLLDALEKELPEPKAKPAKSKFGQVSFDDLLG